MPHETTPASSDSTTTGSTAGDPQPSDAGTKYLAVIIAGVVLGSVLVIAITVGVIVIVFALRNHNEEFKPKPER